MHSNAASGPRGDPVEKRSDGMAPEPVQRGNATWWAKNPMAYDWRHELDAQQYSAAWFDAIDAGFIHGARLFAHDAAAFDRLIPFPALAGKRVLEIGCGMGLHTELMLRAGAELTSIDLTETAITATAKRLALKGLNGDLRCLDAERLPFEENEFDFVWSWGVIHHSARTGRIVREIARVMRPDGEARVMVYNRDGAAAWVTLFTRYLLGLGFRSGSLDQQLCRTTDGFTARYYTRDQFEDLFRTFFEDVSTTIFGQDADVVPVPRQLRLPILMLLSNRYCEEAQARRGAFIFLTAGRKL